MHHLFIVLISIMLTSVLAVASINYLPWWHKPAAAATKVIDLGLAQVEGAYQVATRATDGVPPAPTSAADGGFVQHFLPVLKFRPVLPPGYTWRYGRVGELDYFCMAPDNADVKNEAVTTAAWRVKATRSVDQMVLNTSCGAASSYSRAQSESRGVPLAITYWVAFSPEIPR